MRFTQTEINALKDVGTTLFGQNISGSLILSDEAFTTRKTDPLGNPNTTWRFLNYRDTHSEIREFNFNSVKLDFSQTRLAIGDLVPGHNQDNVSTIRGKFVEYYKTLSGPNFVLTDNAQSSLDFFRDNLIITIDRDDGLVNVEMKVIIIVQIRRIEGTIAIVFDQS